MKKTNILEFIDSENYNSKASFANLQHESNSLRELDEIYQEVKNAFVIDPNNNIHLAANILFLQAHNEFYIGISQLLRCHLGKALISLRIAIEAAFNTYYFTKHSEHIKEFFNKDSEFHEVIFNNIKSHIKKYKQYRLLEKTN